MKIISNEILQSLVNYLANRPYGEVFQIIPALQKLPDIESLNKENAEKKEE